MKKTYVVDEVMEGQLEEIKSETTMSKSCIVRMAVNEYYQARERTKKLMNK